MPGLNAFCNFEDHMDDVFDLWDRFKKSKKVSKILTDPDQAFYDLVQSEFGMPLEVLQFRKDISKGEVKGLEDRLDNLVKNIDSGEIYGNVGKLWYTPSAFAKADPSVGKLLNSFIHTAQYNKGVDIFTRQEVKSMMGNLKTEMSLRGFQQNSITSYGKKLLRKDAQAKADKLEMEIFETMARAKSGEPELVEKYNKLLKQESELREETELKVYDDMLHYVEEWLPRLTTEKWNELIAVEKKKPENKRKHISYEKVKLDENDFAKIRDKDGNKLSSPMFTAIKGYQSIMDKMHKTLTDGVDAYIESILLSKEGTESEESIKKIRKSLKDKLSPNKEAGYYPHYTRDLNIDYISALMPKMDDLIMATSSYIDKPMTARKAVEQLESYLSGHAKTRSTEYDYSPNFLHVMNTYVGEVNRFNYIATINKNKGEALRQIETMYRDGTDTGLYIENVVSMVNDLHASAVGRNAIKNKQLDSFVRSLLGLEFISKIGFNLRSGVRNSSQILLNAVEWSPSMIRSSKNVVDNMRIDVDTIMKEKGLLFKESTPELQEALGTMPGAHKVLQYNEETKGLEFIPMSGMEKVAKGVGAVAGKAGIIMQKVENVNRTSTFKIGFGRMYEMLNNPGFTEYVNEKWQRTRGKDATATEVESQRKKYATDYAINSVISLHFDYNDFSKAKIIRGPVGKVLGQFQHFGFKFFEKNWEISRKAKNDIFLGEVNSVNAWKAYRMGLVYFAAPALAAAFTGLDFGNIVEHDTFDRMKRLGTWMFGDEEDRETAFYGKGPVMGMIGAPVISDLITLGTLYDVINLDEDSKFRILTGYQDYHNITGDRKTYELIKTLNTSVGRAAYRTLPYLWNSHLGFAIQSELGLYKTKESRRKQELLEKLNPEFFKGVESMGGVGRKKRKPYKRQEIPKDFSDQPILDIPRKKAKMIHSEKIAESMPKERITSIEPELSEGEEALQAATDLVGKERDSDKELFDSLDYIHDWRSRT